MATRTRPKYHIFFQLASKLKNLRHDPTPTATPEAMNGTSSMSNVDEEFRPKIIQRPLTILKRPTNTQDDKANKMNEKPKKGIKPLDQRQKEYAEARLRILGQAKHPEDDLDDV
jgi:hypothetical protein